jgi:hypothetical protein
MISKEDKAGIFGSIAKLKADTIREANEFAASQGKIAIPLSINESPMFVGHFATFEYQFRVVSADDPEARRTSMVPRPDVVIEKTETITTLDLAAAKPAIAAHAASLIAVAIESSVPNADVFVDGKFVGNAPLPEYRLAPGTYIIEFRADGYVPWRRELSLAAGGTSRVVATLQRVASLPPPN